MRRIKESVAEKRLVAWAESNGVLQLKLNIQGRRGWPDRVFFLPGGRPYLVEMKAEGEEPRKLQLYIHAQLRSLGYLIEVHDTAEKAIEFIKRHISLWKRFWEKVDKRGPDECWEWLAGLEGRGYGQLSDSAGRTSHKILAHRLSWIFANGPIYDEALQVMHKCNNKICVNPKHLELGTQSQNMKAAYRDGLKLKMPGIANGRAKLTEAQVRQLLGPKKLGELKKLAEKFGIHKQTVSNIRAGKTWKHLTKK
jgi:hypothetical protein